MSVRPAIPAIFPMAAGCSHGPGLHRLSAGLDALRQRFNAGQDRPRLVALLAPTPTLWSKQVGYFSGEEGPGVTSTYFRNECAKPPVDSDWNREIGEAPARMGSPPCPT